MNTISNQVRFFWSNHANAPILDATPGSLINLLDACLVNGYDPATINTLEVSAEVVTATISAGNPYEVGAVIRVAGATPAALNGDWRVQEVIGNVARWSVAGLGIPDGSAAGVITAKRAPAGWEKVFADGNTRAAYRSRNYADHNGQILYIDDTGTIPSYPGVARVRGYESMSDIDTGVGPWPTDAQIGGGGYWSKATNIRRWAFAADDRRFIYTPTYSTTYSTSSQCMVFGRLLGAPDSDIWAHVLTCGNSPSNAVHWIGGGPYNDNYTSLYLPRALSGAEGAIGGRSCVAQRGQSGSPSYYLDIANLATDLLSSRPVVLENVLFIARGVIAGARHLYHNMQAVPTMSLFGVVGNGGVTRTDWGGNQTFLVDTGTAGKW